MNCKRVSKSYHSVYVQIAGCVAYDWPNVQSSPPAINTVQCEWEVRVETCSHGSEMDQWFSPLSASSSNVGQQHCYFNDHQCRSVPSYDLPALVPRCAQLWLIDIFGSKIQHQYHADNEHADPK